MVSAVLFLSFGVSSVFACLIRAAILYFSCRLHLFISRCFVIGIVLISVLLYQSAAFVFLDGSLVSEGLV